jgi:membrane AbrB-like protein
VDVLKRYFAIFVVSCFGGWIFSLIHVPLPWTLGPLATVIIVKLVSRRQIYWPMKIRNTAMLVIGYVLGSPFTQKTGHHILSQLPAILIMTFVTIALCLIGGCIAGKYLGVHLSTSLLGSLPGGLQQMTMVCEDVEGADVAVVTIMQASRIIVTVFTVPFLVLHGLADRVDPIVRTAAHFNVETLPVLALFAVSIVGSTRIANYIRFPSPYLIAPVIVTAILVLCGIDAPPLPYFLVAVAQVCISIRMGMAVDFERLHDWKKLLLLSVLNVFVVILLLLGIDYLFARISGTPFVTAFISTAPGGITEMGLTAMMVHADLSTVIAYQLVRLLFVLAVCIPAITWWLCRRNKQCIRYSPLE